MSVLDPSTLDISYNGITFPPTMTETREASVRPMYDQAGRTVIYNVYSITLKSTLGDINQAVGQSTDGTLETLRKRLTTPGAELHYNGCGLGFDLTINAPVDPLSLPPPKRDVVWGPKPQLLKWKPLGRQACEIEWSVQVAVPDCDEANYAFALMELNFKFTWDIDLSGYTRRTYSGFLRIPQTRKTVDDRTLLDQADDDNYLQAVYPPTLIGFRRVVGQRTLSEDKCRLDFSVVDQEIGPNYPPEGVVEVSMNHELRSNGSITAASGSWISTLQATYEIARDTDRTVALKLFLNALLERMNRAVAVPYGPKQERQKPLILSFRASHPEIYGKKAASFSASWRVLSTLVDLAKASGLWTAPPFSDAEAWADSLKDTAFHRRGNAKLYFARTGQGIPDVLIDLCQRDEVANTELVETFEPEEDGPDRELNNEIPKPETSWLHFRSDFEFEQKDDLPEIKLLPVTQTGISPMRVLSTTPPVAEINDPYSLSTDTTYDAGTRPAPELTFDLARVGSLSVYKEETDQGASRYVTQLRNTPEIFVTLRGEAVRAGFEITPPALASVGGCNVTPANREGNGFTRSVLGSLFGVTIYGCIWDLRYRVLGVPKGNVPQIDSPFLGF